MPRKDIKRYECCTLPLINLLQIKTIIANTLSSNSITSPSINSLRTLTANTSDLSLGNIRLSSAEIKRILRHVGSHPLLELTDREELLSSIDQVYGPIPGLSRNLQEYGTRSSENLLHLYHSRIYQSDGDFSHTDIIARRESKHEVSLLLDLSTKASPRITEFFLCPVEPNLALSPRTSEKRRWQTSLVFQNLIESVSEDGPIIATCSVCKSTTQFDSPSHFECSSPDCAASANFASLKDIHPGGNRRYYGPVVPHMGRVWVGVTEKLERRSDDVAILTATVYSLFHDQTDVNRRGRVSLKFPTASPRIQWAIFPYK